MSRPGFRFCSTTLLVTALLAGCQKPSGTEADGANEIPLPDLSTMEIQVAERLRGLANDIETDHSSAEAWGRFGMVLHAHELLDEAEVAYLRAQDLDEKDERWHYFLGDVQSILGTDLQAAERNFRSFMEIHPDYAAAHMRLGKVLIALNQPEEAEKNLKRALQLDSGLQPAQVALAQVRLALGDLPSAATLLESVLTDSPRHGQALSTLGQVYMRQGKPELAREISNRARDAASYNLYEDPVMSEMVSEGISSLQIWERAKSFLENGNNEQAILGLSKVVEIQPDNGEAHLQLAVAYGNIGDFTRVGQHLQKTVDLDPGSVEARVRLGSFHLDRQEPNSALPHLVAAIELAPEDPNAGWLLGRALVQVGRLPAAIQVFETTAALAVPLTASAHNDWGNALAQSGSIREAIDHFRKSLAQEPHNPQALFFLGLSLEAQGQTNDAVSYYCQSLSFAPGSPAAARIAALGGICSS